MNWTEILYPVAWLWKPKLYLTFLFFVAAAYLLIVFNWYYSDGDQAGYLLKASRKGWVCKTYEGELAITTLPGVAPMVWNLSVSDDAGGKHLSSVPGKRVVLRSKEFPSMPTTCLGQSTTSTASFEVTA